MLLHVVTFYIYFSVMKLHDSILPVPLLIGSGGGGGGSGNLENAFLKGY